MSQIIKPLCGRTVILLSLLLFCAHCGAQNSYDQLVVTANSLLKQGRLDEAKQTAQQAIQQNANGYMAYAVAAKIASQQGANADAVTFIQKAIRLAPDDTSKAKVRQLAAMFASAGFPTWSGQSSSLSGEDQRKLDVLMLILEDADKAATPEDRAKAFREFLQKGVDFAVAHPEQTNNWVMRAYAAVDLDYPCEGWGAGRKLKELGLENSTDPTIRRVFAELDRKEWLGDEAPSRDYSKWTTEQVNTAAANGDLEVADALGEWYHLGMGGYPQSDLKSLKWYSAAAEQGNSDGQFNLGLIYEKGWGVEKNVTKALAWYRKAAAQGEPYSKLGIQRLTQSNTLSIPPAVRVPSDDESNNGAKIEVITTSH